MITSTTHTDTCKQGPRSKLACHMTGTSTPQLNWRTAPLPYVQVAVDRDTTLKELHGQLHEELRLGAVVGLYPLPDTTPTRWFRQARAAVNRLTVRHINPRLYKRRHPVEPLFPHLEPRSAYQDSGEVVYAYFQFVEVF